MGALPWYLYLVGGAVVLASLAVILWPGAAVRQYERMAAQSTDALASFNQQVFDPARRQKNIGTFRLVAIGGIAFGVVLLLAVFTSRA